LKRWEIFSLLKADFLYRAIPWTEGGKTEIPFFGGFS
jgi:hypothetical protein